MSHRRALVGLIGANIMQSLAPALHADAFAAANIDGYYHLMDVDRLPGRRLPQLIEAAKAAGFAGVNVTFPFKQDVLALLDAVDAEAAQTGSVNTVTFADDGRATGYNTDRIGFRRSFEEKFGGEGAEGATVTLIGAGGAGRAVAFAFMDLGVAALRIHDTVAARAQALADDLAKHYGTARCRIVADLEREVATADGIVNATPLGMHGFPGNPVPAGVLHAGQWAADIIYTPIETAFLKTAAGKGLRVLDGGGMCVHQAVAAFRLFTGIAPDVARMQSVFAAALRRRDALD